jgi:hypothetical protein
VGAPDLPTEKGFWNVVVVIATGGMATLVSTLVYFVTASYVKTEIAAVAMAPPWRRVATVGEA